MPWATTGNAGVALPAGPKRRLIRRGHGRTVTGRAAACAVPDLEKEKTRGNLHRCLDGRGRLRRPHRRLQGPQSRQLAGPGRAARPHGHAGRLPRAVRRQRRGPLPRRCRQPHMPALLEQALPSGTDVQMVQAHRLKPPLSGCSQSGGRTPRNSGAFVVVRPDCPDRSAARGFSH